MGRLERHGSPMKPLRIPSLLLVLPLLAVPVLAQADIVREFRRYYRTYDDPAERVEAVRALEGTEDPGVVEVLVPLLDEDEDAVVESAVHVLARFQTRPPVQALLLELAEQKDVTLRVGILRVLAETPYEGAVEPLLECLEDRAWLVRRAALVALAATGDRAVDEAVVALVDDREIAVRCAALDTLAALDSERVLAPAGSALSDTSWRVRASAIAALGRVRRVESVRPLLERMEVEEGRLLDDLGRALSQLTGRSFGPRAAAWRRFIDSLPPEYAIPTAEELAVLRRKQAQASAQYEPGGTTSFHGIETPSRSILFVVDVSGSMEHEVVEKERFRDGGYPSFSRMDIVKTELIRTIANLDPSVNFNMAAFGTEVKPWKKRPVPANVLNKSSARSWTQRLEPLGGTSNQQLVEAGLVMASGLEEGKTNTYGALAWALGLDGKRPEDYEIEVDTIYFLSDGRPSHGLWVDADDILREVRDANELRRTAIHAIAIGDFQKHFMQRLAEESGGQFVDLGK